MISAQTCWHPPCIDGYNETGPDDGRYVCVNDHTSQIDEKAKKDQHGELGMKKKTAGKTKTVATDTDDAIHGTSDPLGSRDTVVGAVP